MTKLLNRMLHAKLRHACFIALIFSLLITPANAAPTINLSYGLLTGTTPFDADDAPGNDSSNSNLVIRTNDSVVISYQIGVSNEDETNIVLEIVGGPNIDFDLPPFCLTTGVTPLSGISGTPATGETVTCNIGDKAAGSASAISIPGRVLPTLMNGSTVSIVSSSITGDSAGTQTNPGTTLTVSASPKFDILKTTGASLKGSALGPNGEKGLVQVYPIVVKKLNQGFGAEYSTSDIILSDDLSGVSPNALLFQGWAGTPASACFGNGALADFQINGLPYAYTQVADGGPGGSGEGAAADSVYDSGAFTCPSVTAGGTATITISGADLSGFYYPTQTINGSSLSASDQFVVSGALAVWFPVQDIIDNGNEVTIANEYITQSFNSISGQANVDPIPWNNSKSYVLREESPGNGRDFFLGNADTSSYLEGQTSKRSGDGSLVGGQPFNTIQRQSNGHAYSASDYNNLNLCTSFDNSKQIIRKKGTRYAIVKFTGTPVIAQPGFTAEYGTGSFGPNATCDEADSPDGWVSDPALLPGGITSVTKVRAIVKLNAPADALDPTQAQLKVFYTTLANPVGTIVPQWGTFRSDDFNSGAWVLSNYDENTALGKWGDRATITAVVVRVAKDTTPSSINSSTAGDSLSFKLDWSANLAVTPPTPTAQVTLTDLLPKEYSYTTGSSSIVPTSVTVNPDGTTTLVWIIPNAVINAVQTPITYDVVIKNTTPDGTGVANTVIISSPEDLTPETARTATHSMNILNTSILSLFKESTPTLISRESVYGYELSYANTGSGSLTNLTFIDVLPDNAWGRTPSTNFSGASDFISVVGSNNEVFEYTKESVANLNQDPADASNQPAGSTLWCTSFSGGSCPANAAEVTAFRATVPNVLTPIDGVQTVQVNLSSSSNVPTNVYSNNFTAIADELGIPITSVTAKTEVQVTYDYSDAPSSYGSAQHIILSELTIGASIDGENAALFSVDATGDGADEDGVSIPTLSQGFTANINVTVNQAAADDGLLQAWIDWNGDGVFDAGEKIATDLSFSGGPSGVIPISVSVPADATTDPTFARFRWSKTTVDATANASDGEVEDYALSIVEVSTVPNTTSPVPGAPILGCPIINTNGDFENTSTVFFGPNRTGSNTVTDWTITGGGSDTYARIVTGAAAIDNQSAYLGNGAVRLVAPALTASGFTFNAEGEATNTPSVIILRNAADDTALVAGGTPGTTAECCDQGDNPLVLTQNVVTAPSETYRVRFSVKGEGGNGPSGIIKIGTPDGYAHVEVPAAGVTRSYTFEFTATTASSSISFTNYGHFYSDNAGFCDPDTNGYCTDNGLPDGQNTSEAALDDVQIAPVSCSTDYSDAPVDGSAAPASGTTTYGEASHVIIGSIQLGATITAETSSVLNADNASDNGVTVPGLTSGATADVTIASADITATGTGTLHAWIDFNGDGAFDTNEYASVIVTNGTLAGPLTFSGYGTTMGVGTTIARFRVTSETLFSTDFATSASDGEVEDYAINIGLTGSFISGKVFIDANRNEIRESGESGIANTVVVIRNNSTGICQSVTTTASGDYRFDGVFDGDYEVYQAHGETTPTPQNCGPAFANNPTGYQSTTADTLNVTVLGANQINHDFGEIQETSPTTPNNVGTGITFEPNHQSEILPGNTVFYAHVFSSEANGGVRFTAPSTGNGNVTNGWTHTLYRDSDCNGTLNGTEANAAINGINFGISAGNKLCIINKVYAPANVPAQDRYEVNTTAAFTFTNVVIPPASITVKDLTIAGQTSQLGASRLELIKTVENLSQMTPPTETLNQAKPGDLLEYRIVYRNTGSGPITDLRVNDTVPAYTGFISDSNVCGIPPTGMTCTPNINANFDQLNWAFTGSLIGGTEGYVSYEVMVDN